MRPATDGSLGSKRGCGGQLGREDGGSLGQRGAVPGQVTAADQGRGHAGEALGAVPGGETVRLVRQHDDGRLAGGEITQDEFEKTRKALQG